MEAQRVVIRDCVLILGDCLSVLPTLEAGSVDACITDPPYGIDYQSARRIDKATWKPKIDNDKRPFVWWLPAAFAACKDASACLLCFCRWDVQQAFHDAIGWAGWDVTAQVIWDRESHGMGDLNGTPAPRHDVVWYAVKGDYHFHGERPKSVIRSMRLGGEQLVHPNQKPDDLLTEIVERYAPPHSLVLDPFLGSGTTLVACARTGRRGIGIESDPKYFDIACKRIEAEYQRTALIDSVASLSTQGELFEDLPLRSERGKET